MKILKTNTEIFLPSLFFQLGTAMTLAFNPLWSMELGASVAMVGLIAGARGIGNLIFDLPLGWLAGKIKDRVFLSAALGGLMLCSLLTGAARTPWQLLIIRIFQGMLISAWSIGRVAYIRRNVSSEVRGRTMSFLGGIMRAARIVAPALGGLILKYLGYRLLYFIQAGFIFTGFIIFILLIGEGGYMPGTGTAPGKILKETFRKNGKNILAAMIGITGLMLLRMSRNLLVPLWADYIGVSVTVLGIITSAGAVIETLLVIPAGQILDRKGRKWSAVPCTVGFAVGMGLLPLTGGPLSLAAVYALIALANGLGSGINMTISSDLAPKKAASEFLGIWRFFTDSGAVAGPLAAGYIAQVFGLALSPLAAAVLGLAAGLVILFGMKETGRPQFRRGSRCNSNHE